MLYVQVTAAYRATFGLQSNPSLLGRAVTVTGTLTAYFSHAGLKTPTAMSLGGGGTPAPTPTPVEPTGSPYDSTPTTPPRSARPARSCAARCTPSSRSRPRSRTTTVWDALKDTDQDPANATNVILLYTGRSQSKSSNGGGVDDWNREHVWAKSHGDFGTATGPGTDLHHLRPEDVAVNSTRGNKDFDNGGSAVAEAPGCYTDADSLEPRNAVKGDVARMIMYMAIRYEGDDGWPNLEINNSVSNGTAPYLGKLSVLLQWHAQDPPDAFEKRRNERHLRQLAEQPQPVHRPPGVGNRHLELTPRTGIRVRDPRPTGTPARRGSRCAYAGGEGPRLPAAVGRRPDGGPPARLGGGRRTLDVVGDVGLDAGAREECRRVEARGPVRRVHRVPGRGKSVGRRPAHDGHRIEAARAGDLLQQGVVEEPRLCPQECVRPPHVSPEFLARLLGYGELVNSIDDRHDVSLLQGQETDARTSTLIEVNGRAHRTASS